MKHKWTTRGKGTILPCGGNTELRKANKYMEIARQDLKEKDMEMRMTWDTATDSKKLSHKLQHTPNGKMEKHKKNILYAGIFRGFMPVQKP